MKELLEKVDNERQFLKLYYDKSFQHVNIQGRKLRQDEIKDIHQALSVTDSITHFTYANFEGTMDIQTLNSQNSQIISCGLRNCKSVISINLENTKNSNNSGAGQSLKTVLDSNKKIIIYLNLTNAIDDAEMKHVIEGLKDCGLLEYLNMSKNGLNNALKSFKDSVDTLKNLKYLNLSFNGFNQDISSLSDFLQTTRSLKTLDLSNAQLQEAGGKALAAALKNNKNLENLNINNNQLNNSIQDFAEMLKDNKFITHINLSNNYVSNRIQSLTDALEANDTLISLEIAENSIGGALNEHIGKLLSLNKHIKFLNLAKNGLGFIGTKFIAESLKANHTLTNLDISNNNIDEAGNIFIGTALKANSSLTTLNISENKADLDGGIILFARMIMNNKSIQVLDLNNNNIGSRGLEAICYAINCIKELYLSGNKLLYGGIKPLIAILPENQYLEKLVISNNELQNDVNLILEALTKNTTLTSIDLSNTKANNNAAISLQKLLQQNYVISDVDLSKNPSIVINNESGGLLQDSHMLISLGIDFNSIAQYYSYLQSNKTLLELKGFEMPKDHNNFAQYTHQQIAQMQNNSGKQDQYNQWLQQKNVFNQVIQMIKNNASLFRLDLDKLDQYTIPKQNPEELKKDVSTLPFSVKDLAILAKQVKFSDEIGEPEVYREPLKNKDVYLAKISALLNIHKIWQLNVVKVLELEQTQIPETSTNEYTNYLDQLLGKNHDTQM